MKIILVGKEDKSFYGKQAAKEAIQEFFRENEQLELALDEIEITKESSGRPTFVLKNHPEIDTSAFCLSISHTDQFVVVEIIKGGLVGVDIETIRKFPIPVYENFLTPSEKKWIESMPENDRDTYTTLVWSFKESYLKALGVGLRVHPSKVELKHLENGNFKLQTEKENVGINLWYKIDKENNVVITKVTLDYLR